MKRNKLIYIYILTFIILIYPSDAYAYLNPGSGSDFFQLIMGFFAGIFASIKLALKKIKNLFVKTKDQDYE